MSVKEFLKIRRREQIELLSQLRLHRRFNLTSTLYIAEYKEYNLDGQGDIKENGTLDTIVDFQFQPNPTVTTIILKSSVTSLKFGVEKYSSNCP